MFSADHNGLINALKRLGFKMELLNGNILATQRCFNICGDCVWVDNIEELIRARYYGYTVNGKRWGMIFSPL